MTAEFGLPQWLLGMSTYAFSSESRIICTYNKQGIWHLASLDTATGELKTLATPYTEFNSLQASPKRLVFRVSSPTQSTTIVQLDLTTNELSVLRRSSELTIAFLLLYFM